MVTINQGGASGQGSKLKINPSAGKSSRTAISIAVILILILIIGIFFLNQKITVPKVLYSLAGLVQKVEENSFTLEASIPQIDASGNPVQKKEIRTVKVTPATTFSQLTFVIQEGEAGKVPVEKPMSFSDIKIGDYVEVISDQDISQASEFEASQTRFLPIEF
jgi:regulatory protein YycI of two-component signal transduction system YycFG